VHVFRKTCKSWDEIQYTNFQPIFLKKESVAYEITILPVCLVSSPTITLEQLLDFHEIWKGGHAIEGDLKPYFLTL
jgi:hypothetical protein